MMCPRLKNYFLDLIRPADRRQIGSCLGISARHYAIREALKARSEHSRPPARRGFSKGVFPSAPNTRTNSFLSSEIRGRKPGRSLSVSSIGDKLAEIDYGQAILLCSLPRRCWREKLDDNLLRPSE